ncbi:Alpha-tocopherol transfer protein [Symbiodinium microadriaticum]|uniref:Alpha-tocopherol transfer protein n=1 Tax=Symbiodinium microadriaticum TaxID=2951 RepID=A0A1Q9F3T5_SYMMI|nr:Alpha-tocopherol transfer protein [Symbiodinium microadriaticum]
MVRSEWAMSIPASEVSRALKTGLHWLLPGKKDSKDPNEFAAACLVFNMAKLDPEACPIEEYQKLSLFLIERATDTLDVQTRGVALIIDFRGVQFTKLWSVLRLEDIKRGLGCWVGAFPCRLRRIWILDAPLPVRALTSLVKKFLTPKVRNRIDFVAPKDLQRIREDFVDCIVLPESLGGTDPFDWDAQVEGYLRCEPSLPLRSPTLLSL